VLYPYRGKLDAPFAHDYEKILVERAALQSPALGASILRLGMVCGENDPNRWELSEPRSSGFQLSKSTDGDGSH
jgi:hypothetical protein